MADLPCDLIPTTYTAFGSTSNSADGYSFYHIPPSSGTVDNKRPGGYTSFPQGGSTSITYFKMTGILISSNSWVFWTTTSSPDPTGALSPDGPASLIQSSIYIASSWSK